MRIRFFNINDTAAPFFRNLVPFLASRGHEVELVLSKAEYRKGSGLDRAISHLDRVDTIRTTSLGLSRNNRLTKIFVMILYVVHATVYSLFGPDVDRNVFLTQPPLFALWGCVLLKVRRQPYYCVAQDIYPQLAVELGVMSRDTLLTRLLRWLSALTLRKADGVVVIGRCMADRVKTMGVPSERIHFIPNWADERVIYPVDHAENQLRKDQDWKDQFVVLYAGNIGMPQHFDDILAVAEQMKDRDDILFAFIGDGSRRSEVETEVENCQLTNVVLLPFLHNSYPLADILSAGDLHFVPLKEGCTGLAVPSKGYGILAAGRPVIYQGNKEGELARMVLEEDVGTVLACGDVEGLKESVLEYFNQPSLCKIQGERARELAEGSYGRIHALERYASILVVGGSDDVTTR